jgi:hypothetical protein
MDAQTVTHYTFDSMFDARGYFALLCYRILDIQDVLGEVRGRNFGPPRTTS